MNAFTPQTLRSGCKINLYLQIRDRLPDGYHNLETLFYPLSTPFDEMYVEPGKQGLTITCARKDLCGQNNILHKAWSAFIKAGGKPPAMHITLQKGVPDGAGLGGGSANAAALLVFLNGHATKRHFTKASLHAIAATVGADVPFFLQQTPCIATGIGEKLVPVPVDLAGWHLVLVCPDVHISSAWAYTQWDTQYAGHIQTGTRQSGVLPLPYSFNDLHMTNHYKEFKKSTPEFLTTPQQPDSKSFFRNLWLFNSFETVVFTTYSVLRYYKNMLLEYGASAALLSGSGSSLFGIFRTQEQAKKATTAFTKSAVIVYYHRL